MTGVNKKFRELLFLELWCCTKQETSLKEGKLIMKRWLFVLLMAVACSPGVVSAQDTAYKALRALGAQRGEKALGQVMAIVGHSGRPQPVDWEITLEDPTARGGVRELDIVSGLISSERAPVHPPRDQLRSN